MHACVAEFPPVLSWATRLNIAVGAARGLAFLHDHEKPVIYRDFKTSNILLDPVRIVPFFNLLFNLHAAILFSPHKKFLQPTIFFPFFLIGKKGN